MMPWVEAVVARRRAAAMLDGSEKCMFLGLKGQRFCELKNDMIEGIQMRSRNLCNLCAVRECPYSSFLCIRGCFGRLLLYLLILSGCIWHPFKGASLITEDRSLRCRCVLQIRHLNTNLYPHRAKYQRREADIHQL